MSEKLSKLERFLIKQEAERLKKEEKAQYDFIRNHEKVYNRREFMGLGLLSGFSYLTIPSILTLAARQASAQPQNCVIGQAGGSSGGGSPWASFLQVDLRGGSCLSASVIPLKKDGSYLSASGYEKFGYGSAVNPNLEQNHTTEFGCKMDTGSSFYLGIKKGLSDAGIQDSQIENKIRSISFATETRDDNAGNKLSATQIMNQITGQGKVASIVTGTSNTANGSFHASAGSNKFKSVRVTSENSLNSLVDIGPILSKLNRNQAQQLLDAAQKMSEKKLNEFNKKDLTQQLKDLVNCGFLNANHVVFNTNTASLSPKNDNIYTSSFGDLNQSANFQDAVVAKLILTGQSNVGGLTLNGYDYHNNQPHTAARSGTVKRFEAGEKIGKFIAAAVKANKELSIFVATDGSASCRSNAPVSTQSATTGAGFLSQGKEDNSVGQNLAFFYSPNGFEGENLRSYQLGDYVDSGAINLQGNPVSTDVRTVIAFAANYLNFHGKINELSSVCSAIGLDNPFKTPSDMGQILVIPKKKVA